MGIRLGCIKALIVAAVFLGTSCFSGTVGKIAGRITDRVTGEPLFGVNVTIKDLKIGAASDANGEYFILNIHPGSYAVIFSMVGYESITKTGVSVLVDRTATVNAKLTPALIEGETITVVAERPVVDKNLTASEQIVTGQSIEKAGIRTIKEALEAQAGIFGDNSSLAWQRGRTKSYVRGSSAVQSVYMVDNISVNSGLVSDNYSGFNTSTIEQISVLTGGYNAEYGEGRSSVVNIISKEAPTGVRGTFLSRVRPAGIYHFGRNFYSNENNDYVSTGIHYWTAQSSDPNSRFFGRNPDSLLKVWRRQTTANDTLAKYANRAEYEAEGTLFGGITDELSFLASGRYKQGVGIFPQAIPYNPEFNIQGYINYKFTP